MFIVRILIIGTSATTGFYSGKERRDNRHVAIENKRERAWGVCALWENEVGIHWNGTLGIASVWTTFYNFVYSNCEKGERKEIGRKIIKIMALFTNDRGTLGDIKWCDYISHTFSTESLVTESLVTESPVTESLVTESPVTESLVTESLVTESLVTES